LVFDTENYQENECKNIEKIDFLIRIMGNFGTKEDILNEIQELFNKINSGKLTVEELDVLVSLSRELHERTIILRYKAFEEKVYGVRPVISEEAVNAPKIMGNFEDNHSEVIAPEEFPAVETEEKEVFPADEPAFQIEIKEKAEPSFGFSLFDEETADIEQGEHVAEALKQEGPFAEMTGAEDVTTEIEEKSPFIESANLPLKESTGTVLEENVLSEENASEINADTKVLIPIQEEEEGANSTAIAEEIEQAEEVFPVSTDSDWEQTNSENIEENEMEKGEEEEQKATFPHNSKPVLEPILEGMREKESEEEIANTEIIRETNFDGQKQEIREDYFSPFHQEERIDLGPSNTSELTAFSHKFNQVHSDLAASQFGLVKLDSLLGSFGLNERLQFINELFDGSSEAFSNAIKVLDQQNSSEEARSKVAELALENQWEIDSETIVEFMQKIARRYA
jgi:hypothetical protein